MRNRMISCSFSQAVALTLSYGPASALRPWPPYWSNNNISSSNIIHHQRDRPVLTAKRNWRTLTLWTFISADTTPRAVRVPWRLSVPCVRGNMETSTAWELTCIWTIRISYTCWEVLGEADDLLTKSRSNNNKCNRERRRMTVKMDTHIIKPVLVKQTKYHHLFITRTCLVYLH